MTQSTASPSGTSEPPTLLSYHSPIPLATSGRLLSPGQALASGIFCYVVRHYGREGVAVLISRPKPVPSEGEAHDVAPDRKVTIVIGDWHGNKLPPDHPSVAFFFQRKIGKLLELMQASGIEQGQYFFAPDGRENTEPALVDAQFSLNKWASPGMLTDLFGTVTNTQTILGSIVLDSKNLPKLAAGETEFSGDLILKPSRFRLAPADYPTPLYFEVTNCRSRSAPVALQRL
jgi:hypothetical protein